LRRGNLTPIDHDFIYQCDGVNDRWIRELEFGSPLFDTSGGAGVLPNRWPGAWPGRYCGYAGGLGPDNVVEQLTRIRIAANEGERFWIDMERRVRSDDDEQFDLDKVRTVLEAVKPLVQA
jgi:phosphoribosylanthranilate isomerase